MQLETIVQRVAEASQNLVLAITSGEYRESTHDPHHTSLGLRRAARLPVMAALHTSLHQPILLLTDRADHALTLYDELALWSPGVQHLFFREPNPLFYEQVAWGETTRRDRLTALTKLAAYHLPGVPQPDPAPILVASARALMTRTIPRRDFIKASRTLQPGQPIKTDQLGRWLFSLGYEPSSTVIAPGQFARRGGLMDVWPPASQKPVRIEFFGDEIDTLRTFEPATQRSVSPIARMLVTPAREFIRPDHEITPGPASDQQSQADDEFHEYYIPLFHPSSASLLSYLPRDALVLIDNFQAFQDAVTEHEEQAIELRQEAIQDGNLPEDFPLPYLTWTEIADTLPSHQVLELGPSTPAEQVGEIGSLARRFSPGPRFAGRLKPFMEHLTELDRAGEHAVIVSRQSGRLQELWLEDNRVANITNRAIQFIQGSLTDGWSFQLPGHQKLHLFTDGEIFGWRRPEPRHRQRPVAESPESAYADLQAGDFIVHVDHGIGCFLGLVNRTIDSIEREYLCIEYANEAQLYVPVHQADRITRYVGSDTRTPSLSHLGTSEWRNVKAHVQEAVQAVAEDLLQLYAKRNIITGHAFNPDTHWQQELEASFPYIETEDQVRVLAEVKKDMEKPLPMDRLICGDVGYGKTEVALRAAFKAVVDGKQVAMLVPTTVLAQQHFQTFRQRLAAFPVEVEMLSRFRSHQEQRAILTRLASGAVDIVIGTHRLFSSDVQFKDLGLLIIDEEQRFGVTHKESLKKMRTEVDVLTLTATPIPRTLYMTLTGVRDISTINTPPEERLPVVTHVGPYTPKLVRQAILRELERGGQVFFVHNRVQTIGAMRNHLERLVPEARITIAHGQMPEANLSERMKQFSGGEVDILLSTSIIESGLDIPNANTLIVDRADIFGLAQLYQLRGRVGRGAQRAYAYFFRHARRQPTLEGRQRLETIAENAQLGAGFSIAMRDLEIRGAGDLLGTRQHGHITAVGFHLYTQLLAQAVRQLRDRGDKSEMPLSSYAMSELSIPVNVDLPLAASLLADYIPDKGMRLRLYRRLAGIRTLAEIEAQAEEFNDRFGPLPEVVQNMLFQLKVKLMAEAAGLSTISNENGQIVLRFPDGGLPEHLPDLGASVRTGKTALWMPFRALHNWREELMQVLDKLQTGSNPEMVPPDTGG